MPLGARNFYLELLCAFPALMVGVDASITEAGKGELSPGEALRVEAVFGGGESAITFMADFDGTLAGELRVGNGKSYLKLTEEKLRVYKTIDGRDTLVHEEENRMNMKEIVMLRIHKKGDKANIAAVSSGEKNYLPHNQLYTVEADWEEAGEIFAVADKTPLKNAKLKFAAN